MFEKITDRIYVQPPQPYTDRPNVGLIVGDKYTLLFEAGNSEKNVQQIKADLAAQKLPMPDFVAVSHWHWDHTFGLHAWNAVTIAGGKTNRQLKTVSGWEWDDKSMKAREESGEDIVFCNEMIKREYPDRSLIKVKSADISFEDRMTVDLGGITCNFIHAKGPHADDSVICFIPQEKFVFLGDSNSKDLYGKPWKFDINHEENFLSEVEKIPYDRELVDEYLSLLKGLDFEKCADGHIGVMTKQELFDSFSTK